MRELRIIAIAALVAVLGCSAHATGTLNILLGAAPPAGVYSGSVTMINTCSTGYISYYDQSGLVCGSITPTTDTYGSTILAVLCYGPGTGSDNPYILIKGPFLPRSYFKTLTLNGVNFTSASATLFSSGATTTEWGWTATCPVTVAGTYSVSYD